MKNLAEVAVVAKAKWNLKGVMVPTHMNYSCYFSVSYNYSRRQGSSSTPLGMKMGQLWKGNLLFSSHVLVTRGRCLDRQEEARQVAGPVHWNQQGTTHSRGFAMVCNLYTNYYSQIAPAFQTFVDIRSHLRYGWAFCFMQRADSRKMFTPEHCIVFLGMCSEIDNFGSCYIFYLPSFFTMITAAHLSPWL